MLRSITGIRARLEHACMLCPKACLRRPSLPTVVGCMLRIDGCASSGRGVHRQRPCATVRARSPTCLSCLPRCVSTAVGLGTGCTAEWITAHRRESTERSVAKRNLGCAAACSTALDSTRVGRSDLRRRPQRRHATAAHGIARFGLQALSWGGGGSHELLAEMSGLTACTVYE